MCWQYFRLAYIYSIILSQCATPRGLMSHSAEAVPYLWSLISHAHFFVSHLHWITCPWINYDQILIMAFIKEQSWIRYFNNHLLTFFIRRLLRLLLFRLVSFVMLKLKDKMIFYDNCRKTLHNEKADSMTTCTWPKHVTLSWTSNHRQTTCRKVCCQYFLALVVQNHPGTIELVWPMDLATCPFCMGSLAA